MYKNVLQSIDNIALWPLISFVIFFLFFLGLILWVVMVDKNFITKMKNIPLSDSTPEEKTFSTNINHL